MEERILMEGITNQVAGLVVKNSHGILTTKRFIYSKHSMAKIMALDVLVNATKGTFEDDIPLADIATATAAPIRERSFFRLEIRLRRWRIVIDRRGGCARLPAMLGL